MKDINYMLYDNETNQSLIFGDIVEVVKYVRYHITNGKPNNLYIRPNQTSVLKALRSYNINAKFHLELFKHLK